MPCYGLSARYFPFWRVGHGSRRPLPASRAEAWNVHGVAHVVTGPCPGGATALPWVYLLCLLLSAWLRPVRHSWCTVNVLNTSSTSLIISHACLRWTWLFGACWTALHVVGVSLFCEAGERCVSGLAFGTRQLWWPWVACLAAAWEAFECVHYIIIDFVSSMYGHWYWREVVLVPSFWISRGGESGGVVHVAWSLGSWEARVASECRLCWCLHTGTWCTWGIDQLSCVYFSLYWDLSSRCIGPGMTS